MSATLPTKVYIVKAMVFPVVMYKCENWTMKKAEHWRTDAFELWCWRRLLRLPWTARRSNQSILMEISPDYSLEGLMLKLKLQSIGHLMQRTDSLERPWCWERLKAGEGDDRGCDGWMASLTQWAWVWVRSGSWWWTGKPGVLLSMGSQRVKHNWATELNSVLTLGLSPSPWRRKWQPTPVLLPGKSYGQRSLVGYRPWGCKESDMTERRYLLTIQCPNLTQSDLDSNSNYIILSMGSWIS